MSNCSRYYSTDVSNGQEILVHVDSLSALCIRNLVSLAFYLNVHEALPGSRSRGIISTTLQGRGTRLDTICQTALR